MKRRYWIPPLAVLVGAGAVFFGAKLWAQKENVFTALRIFNRILTYVQADYVRPVDPDQLVEAAIDGMLQSLDPQSMYLRPDEYADLRTATEGEFGGLGVTIDVVDKVLTIISPLEGTPAWRLGLASGDQIVAIDGQSTEGLTTRDAVGKLRGRPGTQVKITIRRSGVEATTDYTITRETIRIRAVPYAGTVGPSIGYVRLAAFQRSARDEVQRALDSLLTREKVTKLVLDLRGNSGGLLQEGFEVADLFLPRGRAVVATKGRIPDANREFVDLADESYDRPPLVVLVDGWSASASEIVAGAIQDWERGLLVGVETYGKGSVQNVFPIEGGGLRLTTAYWYTPSGRCIDKPNVTHRDSSTTGPMTEKPTPKKTFYTLGPLHRAIYGEGGLQPDLTVEYPRTTALEAKLGRNTFFDYALRYVNRHPGIKRDFVVTDEMLEDFRQDLVARKVEFTPAQFDSARAGIRISIRSAIALKLWGTAGQYEALFSDDPMLKRAVETLKGAESTSDLFRRAIRN